MRKLGNGYRTRECDCSKIMALALPQYFKFENGWSIVLEFVLNDNYKPD